MSSLWFKQNLENWTCQDLGEELSRFSQQKVVEVKAGGLVGKGLPTGGDQSNSQ